MAEPSGAPVTSEHAPVVTFHRGFSEWRSECACGYVGSYWSSPERASRDAQEIATKHMSGAGRRQTDPASGGAE